MFVLMLVLPFEVSCSQINLPSSLFPSIDLNYIEDKYSGLSTQALLNVLSSLKGFRGGSPKDNSTKVSHPSNVVCVCKGISWILNAMKVPSLGSINKLRYWGPAAVLLIKLSYCSYMRWTHAFLEQRINCLLFALTWLLMMLQIWVPTNPRGAERLPPGIVTAETDLYLRRLWGLPSEVCVFFHSSNAQYMLELLSRC